MSNVVFAMFVNCFETLLKLFVWYLKRWEPKRTESNPVYEGLKVLYTTPYQRRGGALEAFKLQLETSQNPPRSWSKLTEALRLEIIPNGLDLTLFTRA